MIESLGLWIAFAVSSSDTLACTPITPAGEAMTVCAERQSDGTVHVRREALRTLAFDRDGLAVVLIHGDFHYVNRAGRTAPALRFDNGADYFVEGLARTVRDGKIGFIDKRLVEIIPARWDFAFPFEHGVAIVCERCKPAGGSGHDRIEAGAWGYIDRKGRPVVPPVHAHEALPSVDDAVKASRHVR